MESDDTEYMKLPLEDRCVHKLWKARLNGYEECSKQFAMYDEKSPEFNKFAPLMKKFVTDSNAVAQEKALDAVLVFATNANIAGRTTGEVISGIVAKCLAAPKRTTQEKAIEVVLMYCEIEKGEVVQEELIKGFSQKNPKVVVGCVKAINTALREFGNKVMNIKPLVKVMGTVLEDRDKNVREEGKKMVIEMYRWVGAALKSQMSSLKPIQIQELEAEFEKLGNEKPTPTRLLRSQQGVQAKVTQEGDVEVEEEEDEGDGAKEIDPADLCDPVNILDQLPKDFYEKVESKKWQERKEAMEILLPLSQYPKLENGDYLDLAKSLRKIIGKDSNVLVISLAGQCLSGIAKGLKKKFSSYAIGCLETIFDKFKEKKTNVVSALRDASDSLFHCTSLEAIQEISVGALKNKNPNVKAETASFLARSLCYCTPTILNKKVLKVFTAELIKALNESDPNVRDNAAEALGTAYKVVGEKVIGAFLTDVDPLKMQKVKEYSEKAQIKVKISVPKAKSVKPAAPSEPSKPSVTKPAGPKKSGSLVMKSKKASESKGRVDAPSKQEDTLEIELSLEESLERAAEILPPDVISGLSDSNWKVRLASVEKFNTVIQSQELNKVLCQALLKTLVNKPGLKDNNFQILKLKLEGVKYLADTGQFTRRSAEVCIQDLIEKLSDPKNGQLVTEVLLSIAEAAKLQWVGLEVLTTASSQKSPKVFESALKWASEAIKEFGFVLNLKAILPTIKLALSNSNPSVRNAAIGLCGTVYMYVGPSFRVHFESEKAAIVQQLDSEFDLMGSQSPPVPSRGSSTSNQKMYGDDFASSDVPEKVNKEKAKVTAARAKPSSGTAPKGITKRAPSTGRNVPSSAKKEEDMDTSPLLQSNNNKQQRVIEEQRLKTLKWDFSTPRAEFISQLKEQLINANANKQLISNMFHQDFKYHIKAIDSLIEDLPSNVESCIANLDLILRWLTIRFFDTNPSVILKAMDYLQQVFTLISQEGYHVLDHEAYSFLPYLIMKFGDPKNSIRGPARDIIKLICSIYPVSKVSQYILDGLKSKNARQRAECLETIGSLIEAYGMNVCQPTVSAALKEIAKQIADRDNTVRNAALNALVQVYFREGDKVYKLIGSVSGKDLSLLEERIKRSAKSRPVIRKPVPEVESTSPQLKNTLAATAAAGGRSNRVIPTPSLNPAPPLRGESNANVYRQEQTSFKHSGSLNPLPTYTDAMEVCDNSFSFPVTSNALLHVSVPSALNLEETREKYTVAQFERPILQRLTATDNRLLNSHDNRSSSSAFENAKRISKSLTSLLDEVDEYGGAQSGTDAHLPYPLSGSSEFGTARQNGLDNWINPQPIDMMKEQVELNYLKYFKHGRDLGTVQRPTSGIATNRNSIKIDYDFIEKLLDDDVKGTTDRLNIQLEEIPDMNSILSDDIATCPIKSKLKRPGYTSTMGANILNANINTEDNSQAINLVISQIATHEVKSVVSALAQLDEVIHSEDKRTLLCPHVDQILIVTTLQYRLVLNTKMADSQTPKQECIKIYRALSNCLMSIFNNKELGCKATRDVLHDTIHTIVSVLLDERLSDLEDGLQVIRALNILVVRIIEKAHFTHVFSALLRLLNESISSGVNTKFSTLFMKCSWKCIKLLGSPPKMKELDVIQILTDILHFMQTYPSQTWADKPNSMPLRTIKTLISHLVEYYGSEMLSYVAKVPNCQGSEVQKYVIKFLNSPKSVSVDDEAGAQDSNKLEGESPKQGGEVTLPKSPKKLSKSANTMLSEIFKKIGFKENTKEGLVQLYEFKLKNPDADIDSYLRKSSQFFQNYIEKGLKKVEMERQSESKMSTSVSSDGSITAVPLSSLQMKDKSNVNFNELVDQFKSIAAKAGFDNTFIDTAVKDIYKTDKKDSSIPD